MADSAKKIKRKLDLASLGGLAVAFGGIIGGLLLEGGRLSDISQITAAMIVLGGTFGAVMVTTPMSVLVSAFRKLPSVFWYPVMSGDELLQDILRLASKARRTGMISLDGDAEELADPFFRKTLQLAVDGTDLKVVRRIMDLEIEATEAKGEAEAKVFDAAGGYSPTVGIIGAVLGLIQVMKHLEDIQAVGHGIAVAFVATVYGVFVANIFFLPIANKLKTRSQQSIQMREMALEGVIAIAEGMNPKLIESQLERFLDGRGPKSEEGPSRGGKPERRAAA
ncbi:MAG: flagellar motor protein [Bryobacteraceae bacterium]